MSVAVCQQPNYFPWIGYLEQCARADELVILDSVQWIRRGLQHRAKILAPDAASDFRWLTLPVRSAGHRERPLGDLELDRDQDWPKSHWGTIAAVYGGRPYFRSQVEAWLRPWYESARGHATLLEASSSSMRLCFEILGLSPRIRLSSELPEAGRKTERLVSLCRAVGAETYYSGLASASYLDASRFRAAGIQVVWQRFKCEEYPQGRSVFRSHLSVIDALANVPVAEIRRWLEPHPWGPFGRAWSEIGQTHG